MTCYEESSAWEDVFAPSLTIPPEVDIEQDCHALRQAMKGLGTREQVLIDIMGHRTWQQRTQIVETYKCLYGRCLLGDFKSETSGNFQKTLIALCYTPRELDARELRLAMAGKGTNEATLIEIVCTRSNQEIREIREIYSRLYKGRDLEKDVISETSGHFKKILVALLQAHRDESTDVDQSTAEQDAHDLYKAGEGRWGTDESKFIAVFASRSYAHLAAVFEEYRKISKKDILEVLKSEMSGHVLEAFLTIAKMVQCKQKYFANRLKKSMKRLGTDDQTLIRIIVSRCETDLEMIKEVFYADNNGTLVSWVKDDTTGDYKRLLLALLDE